jgi:hypothetical protein
MNLDLISEKLRNAQGSNFLGILSRWYEVRLMKEPECSLNLKDRFISEMETINVFLTQNQEQECYVQIFGRHSHPFVEWFSLRELPKNE